MLLALVVTACLAGCSATGSGAAPVTVEPERAPHVVQGAAPGEPGSVLAPGETPSVEAAPHTSADVAFVQGMLHHHAQALFLVDMLDGRTEDERLVRFAERLDVTQVAEIDLMETWLTERGAQVPPWREARWEIAAGDAGGHGGHEDSGHGDGGRSAAGGPVDAMPGMLSTAELQTLGLTEGVAFERSWLAAMTRHHEGVLTMIEQLYAAGGGQEVEVATLASHMEADQHIEITRMSSLLAEL